MREDIKEAIIQLYKSGKSATWISKELKIYRNGVCAILNKEGLIHLNSLQKAELFWSKLNKNAPNGCWEWPGANSSHWTRSGYGVIQINGRKIKTHRHAYELAFGKIPDGLFVCHKCDNKLCCNPDHFFLGTNRDNIIDLVVKNKKKDVKLTTDNVIEIRTKFNNGANRKYLSEEYNVSLTAINNIIRRLKWKFI